MEEFDGKNMMIDMDWQDISQIWTTDACSNGCGGWCLKTKEYFHSPFPNYIQNDKDIYINELECLALVIALKKWGNLIMGKRALVMSDNEVTVTTVNMGRARNSFTQKCLREITYLTAKKNALLKVKFIKGKNNEISDSLSRWEKSSKHRERLTD